MPVSVLKFKQLKLIYGENRYYAKVRYQSSGVYQGVSGTLDSSSGNSVTRELYFGTCSSGVCRPHGDLNNMKFEVISELTNGRKTLKRFKIRI